VIEVSIEAQLYFAPQQTMIGALSFPQGFYINCALEFFGYKAQATIDISANRGISVDAQMDKLVVGNESLFCLAAASGSGGPRLSISTMAQPSSATPEFRLPHFYVSGALQVLGIKQSVLASLTTKGLQLALKGQLAPGVEFDLDAVADSHGFSLDGDVKSGIGTIDLGELGKVKVNTDVDGSLGIRGSDKEIQVAGEASFAFLGEEMQIGRFNLEVKPDVLAHLADTLRGKVEQRLRDEFKDSARWVNALKKGAVGEVNDAAKVLQHVYGKSEKEAAALVGDLGKDIKAAEKTVEKTASKFGKKLKKLF
jgi:hypothetical protein